MNINDFTEKERKIISKFFDMNTVFNPYDESLLEIDIHWDYIYSIPEFAALKTLHQSPKWHSESELVSGHVEMVANECKSWIECKHNLDEEFAVILMMSALFHDIGKATTTFLKESDNMWHHYGHEVESEKITRRILWDLGYRLREKICGIVRWHMEPFNIIRSKDPVSKIIDLQNKVYSLRSLYYVKKFDMRGSRSADPELTKFDSILLDSFADICMSLNCFHSKNNIDDIKKKINDLTNKKPKLTVEMYIGLPGAGKDTAIAASMSDGKDRAIICRDDIRVELGFCEEGEKYLGTNDEENKVTEVFNRKLKDAAESGKVIVLNNMNNRRKYRDAYKQMLKDYNVCWKYIYVEASELNKNIERRKGQIHELAFRKMVETFEFPTSDEYDELLIINS